MMMEGLIMNEPFQAATHYAVKGKKAQIDAVKTVRYMTREEAAKLHSGSHVLVLDDKGKWGRCKVTSVVTWKTRGMDVDVKLVYGLKEYFTESYREGKDTTSLVVEV
jgi:hypothetical protein